MVNQASWPTFFAVASSSIFLYTERMFAGAAIVKGFACAAFIHSFKAADSFDIFARIYKNQKQNEWSLLLLPVDLVVMVTGSGMEVYLCSAIGAPLDYVVNTRRLNECSPRVQDCVGKLNETWKSLTACSKRIQLIWFNLIGDQKHLTPIRSIRDLRDMNHQGRMAQKRHDLSLTQLCS